MPGSFDEVQAAFDDELIDEEISARSAGLHPLSASSSRSCSQRPRTIALLARRRRSTLSHRLPFGPYMVAGTLVSALWFLLTCASIT